MATYIRLAAVNTQFYAVFTSDALWKDFNPYGVENGIFDTLKSHLAISDGSLDQRLLRYYLVNGDRSTEPLTSHQLKVVTQNQFVWLAYILGCFFNADDFTEFPSLIECAVHNAYVRGHVTTIEPQFLRRSKEWALKLISLRPELFANYMNWNEYNNDPDLVGAAVQAAGKVTDYEVNPCMCYVRDENLKKGLLAELAVKNDPRNLAYVSEPIRDKYVSDRDWIMDAVEDFPYLLEYCERWSDDIGVVLKAFSKNLLPKSSGEELGNDNLQFVSDRLRRDITVCTEAVAQSVANLQSSLVDNIDLLKSAMRSKTIESGIYATSFSGGEVDEIYSEFKDDPEAQKLFAAHDPAYLTSEEFMSNRQDLISVLKDPSHVNSIRDTHDMYGSDPSFYLEIMEGNKSSKTYSRLPPEMKKNKDIALKALELGTPIRDIEEHTGPIFSTNREYVKLAVSCAPLGRFFRIPAQFADDLEIVEIAISKRSCALKLASKRLRGCEEIAMQALDTRAHVAAGLSCVCMPFKWISQRLLRSNVSQYVRQAGDCPAKFLGVSEIALLTLQYSPHRYSQLTPSLKSSREFNLQAAKVNGATLRFMSDEFWQDKAILAVANLEYKELYVSRCPHCFVD